MLKSIVAATLVVAASAETFYWNKNNNFETMSNWKGCDSATPGTACPTMANKVMTFPGDVTIPDADGCPQANRWDDPIGRVMKIGQVREIDDARPLCVWCACVAARRARAWIGVGCLWHIYIYGALGEGPKRDVVCRPAVLLHLCLANY